MKILLLLLAWAVQPLCAQTLLSEGEMGATPLNEQVEVSDERRRLNLNTADREELLSTLIINTQQADQLIAWRIRYGLLLHVYELQAIPEFSLEVIAQLLAWGELYVEEQPTYGTTKTSLITRANLRWPLATAFKSKQYGGLPASMYLRMRHQERKLSFGLLLEQDAGERYLWRLKQQYWGTDHFSFFLLAKLPKRRAEILIGDFRVGFGRGLVCGLNTSFLNNAAGVPIVVQSGIVANTSATEYGYQRGLALSWKGRLWMLSGFISDEQLDAKTYTVNGKKYLSTTMRSGLHRDDAELATRGTASLSKFGLHFVRKMGRQSEVGFTSLFYRYSLPIPASEAYSKYHAYYGRTGANLGLDARVHAGSSLFSGEVAIDHRGKHAALLQWICTAGAKFDFGLCLQLYSPGYHAPMANTISRHAMPENEQGATVYLSVYPSKKMQLRFSTAAYRIPWLTYNTRMPTSGSSAQVLLQYQFNKSTALKLQYRIRREDEGLSKDTVQPLLLLSERQHYCRAQLEYRLRAGLYWHVVVQYQYTQLAAMHETGSLFSTGLQWPLRSLRLRLGFVLYHTDSYSARLYVYEQGAGADFRFRPCYGSGAQYIVALRGKFLRMIGWSLKYSRVRSFINPVKTYQYEIALQLDWHY